MPHLARQLAPSPSILQPNRMAWLWSGKGTVKPHWSNCLDAFLAIQNWTGQLGIASRICEDDFDWQTKGSAGDGRRQNSAWRPDVNGLAIQTQMAQRPRHQWQDLPPPPAVMSKPLQHHCRQDLFRPHRLSPTWGSQAGPRHTHQRCQGCQNPPQHHGSLAVAKERPSSVRRAPELLRDRASAKLRPSSASKSLL